MSGRSDNLGSDRAATWRWNVNTVRVSAAPPHICLHPSRGLSPTLRHPHFLHTIVSSITAHSSEPGPLTRIRRSSCTQENVFLFFFSYLRPMLFLHFSFSFPPVELLFSLFLFCFYLFFSGRFIYYVGPLVSHFMEQRGLSINMQTFPPSLLGCHGP